jgi:predicted nucleic acid-binding protein
MFVLDTNVVSELRRPDKANRKVMAWAEANTTSSFFLSAITLLELEHGTLLMERKDKAQGAALRSWFERTILPRFEGRILPVDTAVARRCATLHALRPRSQRDALIAATAFVHSMAVVTRNTADFAGAGVKLINPWV